MRNYVFLDKSGTYPTQAGSGFSVPDGALEVDGKAEEYFTLMLDKGGWLQRPEIEPPTVSPDGVFRVVGLPSGTVVTAIDDETYAVLADIDERVGTVEFRLVDPGVYEIKVKPPLPWLPWNGKITC